MNKEGRYPALDSLRAIAAIIVMTHHYMILFPQLYPYQQKGSSALIRSITFSPLHFFWAGYEAVVLFFILSGFVLALPHLDKKKIEYGPFIIKRIFRIYPPYLLAMAAALALSQTLARQEVRVLSSWFNEAWLGFSPSQLWQYALLIGPLSLEHNSVIWSLKIEMLVCLVFPFLFFGGVRLKPRAAAAAILLTFTAGFYLAKINLPGIGRPMFLRAFGFFLAGVILARYREPLTASYAGLSRIAKALLLASAVFGFCVCWYHYQPGMHKHLGFIFDHVVMTASSAIFIIAVLAEGKNSFLNWRPLRALGRISYSVYLYHVIILLGLVHLLHGKLSLWGILPLSMTVTLGIAAFSYRLIEIPSANLGKKLAGMNRKVDRSEAL